MTPGQFILTHHHFFSILAAFFLDCLLGDPHFLPHPVRWMGRFISFLEKILRKNELKSAGAKIRLKGAVLVFLTVAASAGLSLAILLLCKKIHPIAFFLAESIICYYCLAAKSLCTESMKVYRALKTEDLNKARKAVSMIVGRDTEILDENGVRKAAVETIAESTNDGVIAPLFYMLVGGPVAAIVYKAINTMDSMIGYKNEKYINFGFTAARLDDLVNLLPSRLAAVFMIISTFVPGLKFKSKNAIKIFLRDRYKHASPNSAQTESVMAGALGLKLAGDTVYSGIVEKKDFIGDDLRPIENKDIIRANLLMYLSTILCTSSGLLTINFP